MPWRFLYEGENVDIEIVVLLVLLSSAAVVLLVKGRHISHRSLTTGGDALPWPEAPNGSAVLPEEYEVYSAVIAYRFRPGASHPPPPVVDIKRELILVSSLTMTDSKSNSGFDNASKAVPAGMEPRTVEDYLAKAQSASLIADHFNLPVSHVLVDRSEVTALTAKGSSAAWHDFFGKYPNASVVTRLSRVGFNPNKDQAMVYMDRFCGPRCGSGGYWFLVKDSPGWKVKTAFASWIA
jgi:hypothetical protein